MKDQAKCANSKTNTVYSKQFEWKLHFAHSLTKNLNHRAGIPNTHVWIKKKTLSNSNVFVLHKNSRHGNRRVQKKNNKSGWRRTRCTYSCHWHTTGVSTDCFFLDKSIQKFFANTDVFDIVLGLSWSTSVVRLTLETSF